MHSCFLQAHVAKFILRALSRILMVALIFFGVAPAAHAKELGLGIIVFGPTGFSTNYFINRKTSIDGALSWNINNERQDFYIHSTFLWHKPNSLSFDKLRLNSYFGLGGRMITWDHPRGRVGETLSEVEIGARGVVGTSHTIKSPAIEFFGELSLVMNVTPETKADFDLAFGARYYF